MAMNFVFTMTDTQNRTMAGAYGNPAVDMPNLELIRSGGVLKGGGRVRLRYVHGRDARKDFLRSCWGDHRRGHRPADRQEENIGGQWCSCCR